jgi:hypothetical protein
MAIALASGRRTCCFAVVVHTLVAIGITRLCLRG